MLRGAFLQELGEALGRLKVAQSEAKSYVSELMMEQAERFTEQLQQARALFFRDLMSCEDSQRAAAELEAAWSSAFTRLFNAFR